MNFEFMNYKKYVINEERYKPLPELVVTDN